MSTAMRYTVYCLDEFGEIVQSGAVTCASDIEAFELARTAVIRERQGLLSRAGMPDTVEAEDAA